MSNVETTITHIGPQPGDNTPDKINSVPKDGPSKFAKDQLKSIIERIEKVEEEKKGLSEEIRDIYTESKGNGYDVKTLRKVVQMRKQSASDRAEAETILETYLQALGMI